MAKGPKRSGDLHRHGQHDASARLFDGLRARGFDVAMISHAEAILRHDLGTAADEIEEVVQSLSIPIEQVIRGGGGEAKSTQELRRALAQKGWQKHSFKIQRIIDDEEKECVTHTIDHVKGFSGYTVALEIEWNNKDPFFDRDLENFKRLHADGAISIGAIITRGQSLHEEMKNLVRDFAEKRDIKSLDQVAEFYTPTRRQRQQIERAVARCGSFAQGWAAAFVSDKFGEATTHWGKLQDRVKRGVGNPCPLLLIGIPAGVIAGN